MLIDDDPHDNFIHKRAIKKCELENITILTNTAEEALEYFKSGTKPYTDLVFLDINMPGMNGWEFLEEYNHIDKESQSGTIIIMLTTSSTDEDKERAKSWSFVVEYITKPLTQEIMNNITRKYFEK
jgi:response regulator of citrate/malate metabolism